MHVPDDIIRQARSIMRMDYSKVTQAQVDTMAQTKEIGAHLMGNFLMLGESEEMKKARQHLEEAIMWASKHISTPK